jgi:ADP-ribose pyrophosphatase YjhB (NUDIX family)
VVDDGRVLLIHRTADGRNDWVLPGGRPRTGESLAACAGREAREETGLEINPMRVAFVLEVIDPPTRTRTVEVVFLGSLLGPAAGRALAGEPGAEPEWVPRSRLPELDLKPPIGGHLPAVMHPNHSTAPYLGNLWKPEADAVADGSAGRWRRWARGRP